MMMVMAKLGMSVFPTGRAGAVRGRQMTTERAREQVEGPVVVTADRRALLVSQCETQPVEDLDGPAAMATAVSLRGLAQIVEQSDDGNAVGRVTFSMREHMLVYFKGMLCKATVLLVMAVTPALEVTRGKEVVDNGFHAGAPGGAKDLADPVSCVCHSLHAYIYSPQPGFLHVITHV